MFWPWEIIMFGRYDRWARWGALLACGCVFQLFGGGCTPNFDFIQTVLLSALVGTTLTLVQNV